MNHATSEAEDLMLFKIRDLGFNPKRNSDGEWIILPLNPQETWSLQLTDASQTPLSPSGQGRGHHSLREDRWMLSVNGTPQIAFLPQELLWFLRNRVSRRQHYAKTACSSPS
ncbi:hypothetical protein [Lyngbya confervoides]|uniref:Uncharacterized protein n=1 Tax=Lyngbya confervoides BDU141951 TaxID=1574623 RepID=A0ABD4T5M6_9CYAN|nr:hypothetical protein [Lyngbya confervoides]MCM1983988.1 hypothetical protein [Lyngbya confervoides BDU141951]